MTAKRSLSMSATRHVRRKSVMVAMTTVLAMSAEVVAQEPVTAVLKAREVDFSYRSSDVFYPCRDLQLRVAVILRAVGARDDVQVRASGCDEFAIRRGSDDFMSPQADPFDRSGAFDRSDGFEVPTDRFRNRQVQPDQTAHIQVRLMSPVIVTPAVLAEIDKDKSRRELVSRVTGNPMMAMNDPILFAAQRQEVTLSRQTIGLEPEDCELLKQMSSSVFRELDIRVLNGAFSCSSRIGPQLRVEALLPVAVAVPNLVVNPGEAAESESDVPAENDPPATNAAEENAK